MLAPWQFLISALLVGAALWLSRAVSDVVGSGVRVAYLPSVPELAGLVVLSGLVLTLVQAIVERGIGRLRPGAHVSADAIVPLGAVALLALPYLPWLGDSVPLVAAVAGPLGVWIWAIVAIQAVWALGAGFPPRVAAADDDRVPSRLISLLQSSRAAPWWVGAATAVLLGAAAWHLAPGAVYPGGDEPHYLVVTQSIVDDGDLRIDDNHARGDYRAFFPIPLKPDHIVPPGPDGAIYSIHPIGVSLLVAPGFALYGYRGASLTIIVCAAVVCALLWQWLRAVTKSVAAATFGWLAIATSTPFLLHGFAIYPEVPAAMATMVALAWRRGAPDTPAVAMSRGLAIGILPWLGTKYAPMATVIGGLLLVRARGDWRRLFMVSVPAITMAALWLGWFWWIWGTPLPTAPYGSEHQMALWHQAAGLPGLFFDQEYGIFAVAPLLAMAMVGWWRLWRRDAEGRALAVESGLPIIALAVTTSAYAMWWGGSSAPGRQVVAALPLLGIPLATLWKELTPATGRRAVLVMLLAVGIATTGTLVLAREGLLIANDRDGTSELLSYLAPSGALTALVPSFTADRTALGWPLTLSAIWMVIGALLWFAAGRTTTSPGRAGLRAVVATSIAVLALASLPAFQRNDAARPSARVQSLALDDYDSTARPIALIFDPWHVVSPSEVPRLVRFEATPGLRRAPQPLRVLLNMRLALPAGTYAVTIDPRPGVPLSGEVALQVGRRGPPRQAWSLSTAAGESWRETFSLDLDSSFVGLRTSEAFESAVARVVLTPERVVETNARLARPPVLAATAYAGMPVYFHDSNADIEGSGFWARGRATTALTLGVDPSSKPPGVRLRMHSGEGTTRVRVSTPGWSTQIALTPGQVQSLLVPALEQQRLLPVALTADGGFVPAEHGGAANDRRLLGCWVEVVP